MKISSKQSRFSRKTLWASAVVLLLLISSAGVFYYYQNQGKDDPLNTPVDYSSPTKAQSDAGSSAKQKAIERGEQNGTTGSTPHDANLVTMETIYNKDSQQIVVTTKLANTASWNKCYLEVKQGSVNKSFEARTVYQPDASFCGGFSVPTQGMSGNWEVSLTVTDLSGKEYKANSSVVVN